jgi:hypothetical protein
LELRLPHKRKRPPPKDRQRPGEDAAQLAERLLKQEKIIE